MSRTSSSNAAAGPTQLQVAVLMAKDAAKRQPRNTNLVNVTGVEQPPAASRSCGSAGVNERGSATHAARSCTGRATAKFAKLWWV